MNSNELLKKWDKLLDYDSKEVPKVEGTVARVQMAELLEEAENLTPPRNMTVCEENKFISSVVCTVRKTGKPLEIVEIKGREYYVIVTYEDEDSRKDAALPLEFSNTGWGGWSGVARSYDLLEGDAYLREQEEGSEWVPARKMNGQKVI